MKPKILFVLFYFPPFSRVGGRRWAKHIKYFQKFGEDFHVLAGDYDTSSPWDNDIVAYKDKITRIPISIYYPFYKKILPTNLLQKIKWILSLWYNKKLEKDYKGNFWDDSRNYEKQFYDNAKKIILTKKITHICLSVGPFSYANVLTRLRKEFKDLKITIDFRDYWEDSFVGLTPEKINDEEGKLNQVMNSVNLVLAPNFEMSNYYKEKYNKNVYCLPHCIDEEYLNINSTEIKNTNNKDFVIIYGGTLYNNMEAYILQLIDVIRNIEVKGHCVKLKIFTMQPNYVDLFLSYKINFTINENLPTVGFINEVVNSDLLVLFRPDWSPNGFSTKFFEYVAFRKPMLYLGPKGEVNKFILENKLGYTLDSKNTDELAKELLENRKTKSIPYMEFDLKPHTFDYQTKKLIQFWNNYYVTSN